MADLHEQRQPENVATTEAAKAKAAERQKLKEFERRRDTPPSDYTPPSSVAELLERYARGERYFADTTLADAIFPARTVLKESCLRGIAFGTPANVAVLTAAVLDRCNLAGAKLSAANLQQASLQNISSESRPNADDGDLSREHRNVTDLPASFRGADLTGANLAGADLCRADLRVANLRNADLSNALLDEAQCNQANIEGAILHGTRLRASSITSANNVRKALWAGADFRHHRVGSAGFFAGLDLAGIKAEHGTFEGAAVRGANLCGADLKYADFSGADLTQTNFEGAEILGANFGYANLLSAKGLVFDENNLGGARLPPRMGDRWSTLRRKYTGARFILNLMFLLLFFTPYVIRISGWIAINRAQEIGHPLLVQAESELRLIDTGLKVIEDDARAIKSAAADNVTIEAARQISVRAGKLRADARRLLRHEGPRPDSNVGKCLRDEARCKEWPVWKLLLGMNQPWILLGLTWILLLYNVLRAGLTWFVIPLREDEDRTNVTPRVSQYKPLVYAHWFATGLWIVSIGSFAYHACHWLKLGVSLPVH